MLSLTLYFDIIQCCSLAGTTPAFVQEMECLNLGPEQGVSTKYNYSSLQCLHMNGTVAP